MSVLGSLPSKREARSYLKKFQQKVTPKDLQPVEQRTGLVNLSPNLSSNDLFIVVKTLLRLRQLGLFPIIVLSSHIDPLDRLKSRDTIYNGAFRVVEAIERANYRATPLNNVFTIHKSDAITADLAHIHRCINSSQIPVIGCLGDKGDLKCPIPTKSALISLAQSASNSPSFGSPLKFIIINSKGGISLANKHITFVNMKVDFDSIHKMLSDIGPSESQTVQYLELIQAVLENLSNKSSAILTNAATSASLISNLITDKPFVAPNKFNCDSSAIPTVFRSGLSVAVHTSLHSINTEKLTYLLESSFRKKLDKDGFFERLSKVGKTIMIAGSYDGAVIVTKENSTSNPPYELPYLDKFAVDPSSQGLGVADILWSRLIAEYPNLCWRSRIDNPVNRWFVYLCYFQSNLIVHY